MVIEGPGLEAAISAAVQIEVGEAAQACVYVEVGLHQEEPGTRAAAGVQHVAHVVSDFCDVQQSEAEITTEGQPVGDCAAEAEPCRPTFGRSRGALRCIAGFASGHGGVVDLQGLETQSRLFENVPPIVVAHAAAAGIDVAHHAVSAVAGGESGDGLCLGQRQQQDGGCCGRSENGQGPGPGPRAGAGGVPRGVPGRWVSLRLRHGPGLAPAQRPGQ